MLSERITRILLSKGITEQQLAMLSEGRAWQLLYEIEGRTFAKRRPKNTLPEICFTGFTDAEKPALVALAREHGYAPKDSVTVKLKILVTGAFPGPNKLDKARAQGCQILSEAEFRRLVASSAATP
jgi:NAD-dependent DNA ligase